MDSDEGLSCDPLALILSFTSHADACALILAADTESTELKGKYLGASHDAPFSQPEKRKYHRVPIIAQAVFNNNQPYYHHSPLISHACRSLTYSANHLEETFRAKHCKSPRSIDDTNLTREFHNLSPFLKECMVTDDHKGPSPSTYIQIILGPHPELLENESFLFLGAKPTILGIPNPNPMGMEIESSLPDQPF
nr:hypothetical protein CFP56_18492 [Quercus suber]